MCELCGLADHRLSRRGLMAGASAALAASAFPSARLLAAEPPKEGASNAISPDAALQRIMEGNARYAANAPNERDFSAGRAVRSQGQAPIAAILSCADSRIAPELAFDQQPGDIFVLRVAGNIVNNDLLASIEYGVQFLGAPLVMVLGHSSCGAVDAAIKVLKDRVKLPGHLPELIAAIKPSVSAAEKSKAGELLDNATVENVRRQVARLKTAAPLIRKQYAAQKIDIVGGMYDIATGKVTMI